MAQSDAKKSEPKHTDAGPDIAPHGREKMMEAHRDRRQDQPAAAPLETDAESGGASAVAGLPEGEAPRDPAKPYLEGNAGKETSEDMSGSTGWVKWAIAALVVLAIIYAVVQI